MENTITAQGVESRVRLNLHTTAKGAVQWEITAEFPTLAESKNNLSAAVDEIRSLIKDKGLEEARA